MNRKRLRHSLPSSSILVGISLMVLSALILLAYFSLSSVRQAEAAWFDSGWSFRKKIPILNSSGSTQTDFQVQLTLDTAALVTAGKLQSDCDDLRFTNTSGDVLSYWLEPTTCNSASTKVWIKVPSIPTSGTDVYFYYGNATASSLSSTSNTFIREISGVEGAWSMDEAAANSCTGGTNDACDSSGHGNDGAWSGSVSSVAGKFGNATSYTGAASDYINIPNSSRYEGTAKLTISVWMQDDAYSGVQHDYFTKGGEGYGTGATWALMRSSGGSNYRIVNASSTMSSVSAAHPSDQWNLITITYDGTIVRYYVNGTQITTGALTGLTKSNGFPVRLGGHASANDGYNGKLDEARIYSEALTAEEITALYGNGSDRHGYTTKNYTGKELVRKYHTGVTIGTIAAEEVGTSPIAHWKLDEGQGQVINDSSTSNNDGVLGATSGTSTDDPTWATEDKCISGKCLLLDGTNDSFVFPDSGTLDQTKTISLWIRPSTGPGWPRLFYGKQDINFNFSTASPTDFGKFRLNATTTTSESHITSSNTWYHVAFVENGANTLIYINGNYASSVATALDFNNASSLKFGEYISSDGNYNFKGFVDEIILYPYRRSAAQVKEDYNRSATSIGGSSETFMSEGLVGYWKMDETAWTNNCSTASVLDSSGNGNHGRSCDASNGPTGAAGGKFGYAGSFDGVDDSVYVGDINDLDGLTELTVSAWIYPTTVEGIQRGILGKWGSGSAAWFFTREGDEITFRVANTGSDYFNYEITTATNLQVNTWYHVTGVYSGATQSIDIYVNGQLQASSTAGTIPAILHSNAQEVIISGQGINNASYKFTGRLDEIRAYKRALTATEVQNLYNYAPGPLGYWKFDEGTGTTAADSSGNGMNGTLVNSAGWGDGKVGNAVKLNLESDLNQHVAITTFYHNYAFTKSAWVYPTTIAGCDGAGNRCSIFSPYVELSGTTLQYYDYSLSTNGWHPGGTINLNQWQYVTVTYDGFSTLKMYINGVQTYSTSVTNTGTHYTNYIGSLSNGTGRNFRGYIDEAKVYNYLRTPAQILEDMGGVAPANNSSSTLPQPVAHYKFDEQSGQTINNSGTGGTSYNGIMGTNTSASSDDPTWRTGSECNANGCLSFDGGDYVQVTGLPQTFFSANSWSQVYWIKTTQDGNPVVTEKNTNVAFSQLYFGQMRMGVGAGIFNTAGAPLINDGNWHHFALTYDTDSNMVRAYIDGEKRGEMLGSDVASNANPYVIGSRLGASGLVGTLDELKLYQTALNESQIKLDMNAGTPLSIGASSTAEAANIIDGAGGAPILEWKFEERTGTTLKDTSGNNRNGTLSGTPSWGIGKVGSAAQFDGIDDYGSVASVPSSSTGSYSFWVKPNQLNVQQGWIDSNTQYDIFQWDNLIYFRGGGNGNQVAVSLTGWTVNEWRHITMTWDGTTTRAYVDGVQVGTVAQTGTFSGTVIAGRVDGGYFFNGSIDELKVYNYARTPAQIAYDFNRGAPIAHWKLNECEGSVINNSITNSNVGTLVIGGSGTQTAIGTCDTSGTAWGNGADGKYGASLNFDGTNDYVDLGDLTATENASAFTLSAWIKPNTQSAALKCILCKFNSSSQMAWSMQVGYPGASTSIIVGVPTTTTDGNTYAYTPANTITVGEWQHVAMVFNGTTTGNSNRLKVYINGVLQTLAYSGTTPAVSMATTSNARIGATSDGGRYFNGQIDDVRVHSYALSENQIKQIINEDSSVRFGEE